MPNDKLEIDRGDAWSLLQLLDVLMLEGKQSKKGPVFDLVHSLGVMQFEKTVGDLRSTLRSFVEKSK